MPCEEEILTTVKRLNEYIMTALRTIEGINLGYVVKHFGEENKDRLIIATQKIIHTGRMVLQDENLKLTKEGQFFADGIAGDLFV